MTTKPKRHHFLPEFYLRGFTRDELVWLYDREKKAYRRQSPKNTAVIGHYYAVQNTSGEVDYGIEEFLSQAESKARPVIAKLEAGGVITPDERFDLACFITLLLSRTPKFEREIERIADAAHKLLAKEMIPTVADAAELLRRSGKAESVTPESMFKFIHEEQFQIKGNRNIMVRAMLDQTRKFTKNLALMDWLVVHAVERSAFITTDSPLGFIVPDEFKHSAEPVLGIASEKVIKIIPLTQRVALLIGHYGAGFGHASFGQTQVREFNIEVAKECGRYVIGRDEALVRSVVHASGVDVTDPGSRMIVENVSHPSDPKRTFLVARRVSADAVNEPFTFPS